MEQTKACKMPRKKKYDHSVSQICGMGTDPVWDDTELVKQFDEVLREWKQETKFWIPDDDDSHSEEVQAGPSIGPWVAVENHPNDDQLLFEQTEVPPIPFLDDYEMISLYNEALSSWKAERRPSVHVTSSTGV